MLSLSDIRKILDSGKPVVWTMHDMWPATAICHLTLGCRKFTTGCSACPLLPAGLFGDTARHVWRKKQRLLKGGGRLIFVACSKWLASEARQSKLLEGKSVVSIPNPIDRRVFCPGDKAEARRLLGLPEGRRLMLFVAQRVSSGNKGAAYLIEACRLLSERHPDIAANMGIVMLGGSGIELAGQFAIPAYPLGYVSDTERIVAAYRAADLFVMPSLSENLPNTIMEAMACGVPCVGFNTGGIPEMIDHRRNGYVAAYKDAADLAAGIRWALADADAEELGRNAGPQGLGVLLTAKRGHQVHRGVQPSRGLQTLQPMIKFSIVTITFNAEGRLAPKPSRSVARQGYPAIEHMLSTGVGRRHAGRGRRLQEALRQRRQRPCRGHKLRARPRTLRRHEQRAGPGHGRLCVLSQRRRLACPIPTP